MHPDLQRRVQRYGWDKASDYYENSWKEQLKPAQEKLIEFAELKPGEKILETACGTGLVTQRIVEAVQPKGEILATDLSENMLKLAEERVNVNGDVRIQFKWMDAEDLDLDDQLFDVTLSGLGLMYVPDPVQSLKEKYRVLKPKGRVALAIWGERKQCGWADIFPIVDKRVETDVCPMFFQQGTGETLAYSLKNAGFSDIETERFSTVLNYPTEEMAVMAAFAGGPVALAYRKFDDEVKKQAHKEYLDSIAPYRKGEGFEIPGEFLVARAVKSE